MKKFLKPLLISSVLVVGIILIYYMVNRFFGSSKREITFEQPSQEAAQEVSGAPKKDYPAPDFKLPDLEGKDVSLRDFEGKAVVLVFWTVWNPAAQDQIAILESYYRTIKDAQEPVLLAIDSQEDKSVAGNFIRRGEYLLPVLLDEEGEVGELYGISALPAFYFIDRTGMVREVYIGVLNGEEMQKKAEKLFSG